MISGWCMVWIIRKKMMKRGELVGFSRCFGYDRDKETEDLETQSTAAGDVKLRMDSEDEEFLATE